MARYIKIFIIISVGLLFFCEAKKVPSFVKEKKVVKKLSPVKLKESIGYELKELLTLSSDLIASLADDQQVMITKMHTLVVQEKGDFFTDATAKELDVYLSKLQCLHQTLKRTKLDIEKQFSNFSKNFTT